MFPARAKARMSSFQFTYSALSKFTDRVGLISELTMPLNVCYMNIWGLSLSLTSYTPTLTYINCRACCIGCEFTEVEQVLLGWSRTIYYSKDHRERWCGGLWSSSRLQISVPALSLCHFPKMWVSLVNTLNPRPKEHIMASFSVGNRLQV